MQRHLKLDEMERLIDRANKARCAGMHAIVLECLIEARLIAIDIEQDYLEKIDGLFAQ